MNWKLIFQLSLFGLAMAVATVYWIPSAIEPLFWLVIFVACAAVIVKKCSARYFFHGFMVSVFNSVWVTAAHVLLSNTYLANHPEELAQMNAVMPSANIQLMMLVVGPLFGVAFGLVLGLFAFVASKLVKKSSA